MEKKNRCRFSIASMRFSRLPALSLHASLLYFQPRDALRQQSKVRKSAPSDLASRLYRPLHLKELRLPWLGYAPAAGRAHWSSWRLLCRFKPLVSVRSFPSLG